METQRIGDNAILLYVNVAELDRWNMDAQRLRLGDVLRLTKEVCQREHIPWADIREIQVYAQRDGAMLLVHLKEQDRQSLFFDDIAQLLDGMAALPEPTLEQMGFWQGRYVLTTADADTARVLSEFGQTANRCDQSQAEREGNLILEGTGIRRLWERLHP